MDQVQVFSGDATVQVRVQNDVGPSPGHVSSHGHSAESPGLLDDLSFFVEVSGLAGEGHPMICEQSAHFRRLLHRPSSYQNRPSHPLAKPDLLNYGSQLLPLGGVTRSGKSRRRRGRVVGITVTSRAYSAETHLPRYWRYRSCRPASDIGWQILEPRSGLALGHRG